MTHKVSLLVLAVAVFAVLAVQADDGSFRKTKDVPVPVDPGFTISTSTKAEGIEVACTRIHDPVCASNGKTYNNKCEFENAQRKDSKLTLVKEGEC